MLDFIKYLFSSFWIWAGFTVWLMVTAQAVSLAFTGSLLWVQRLINGR